MEILTNYEDLKNRLIEMLTNGIEEEPGVFRKMDPIDYYEITNIQPKNLYTTLKDNVDLTAHERRVLVDYVSQCHKMAFGIPKDIFVERIMKEKLSIKNIEITKELKEEAIAFMEAHNMPFAYINYISYLRRVINQLDESMKKS